MKLGTESEMMFFISIKRKNYVPFCEQTQKNHLIAHISVVGWSTTMTDRPTGCQNIILVTYIPNGLPVLVCTRSEYMFGKQRCSLKDVFSYILLHFHVNQHRTPSWSTGVSTMRCIRAPEEELELVGWLLAPGKLDLASRVLFSNSVTIRIQANLLKNVKLTIENKKFPTWWKKVTIMVGL